MTFVLLSGMTAGSLPSWAATTPPVIDGPYLFLDQAIVDSARSNHIRLHPNKPQIQERVITPDLPWEAMGYHYWSQIIQTADGWAMYYRRVPLIEDDTAGIYCLAHSNDGVDWRKPNLSTHPFRGISTNCTDYGYQFVFEDPNAVASERYKKFGHLDDEAFGITGISNDGVIFEKQQRQLLPFLIDTQNVVMWDDALAQYVLYLRGRNEFGRTVVRTQTASIEHPLDHAPDKDNLPSNNREYPHIYEELSLVIGPDREDWLGWQDPQPGMVDVYHSAAMKYPWARNTYLAFPNIYYHYSSKTTPSALNTNDGEFEVQLAVSRDGNEWQRYRTPYVERGTLDGVQMVMMSMGQGMIRQDNQLYQYFIALPRSHGYGADFDGEWKSIYANDASTSQWMAGEKGGIYRATIGLHRFVSATADDETGVLVTKPFVFYGDHLLLNLRTAGNGAVCVALLDEKGDAIASRDAAACDPISGDALEQRVTWAGNSDISFLSGRPVRLRFEFHNADIFAFEFRGDPVSSPMLKQQWKEDFDAGYGQMLAVTGADLWRVEDDRLVGSFSGNGAVNERARMLPQPLTEEDAFALQIDFRISDGNRLPDANAIIGFFNDGTVARNPLLAIWIDDGGRRWGILAGADGDDQRLAKNSRTYPDLSLWPNEDDWQRARLVWDPVTQTAVVTLWNLTKGWRVGGSSAELNDIRFTLDRVGVRIDNAAITNVLELEMDNLSFERVAEQAEPTPSPSPTATYSPTPTPSPTPTASLTFFLPLIVRY